jgi:nucleoside-diphosphate-sugar epimerase
MTILIIGGTGTLGRQIVQQMLSSGYSVRCFVRNIKKARFLSEWGVDLVYGDLKLPETIPNTLKGIRTIIDVSTFRRDNDLDKLLEIDLIGKIALIKAARIANIEGFIFFSITENIIFDSIPLMKLKGKLEKILQNSKIPYTIIQLSGFYQGLINEYAIPILEEKRIYINENSKKNPYINTQDIAKIFVKLMLIKNNFQKEKVGNILQINGPKLWNSNEIILLCEEISGQSAILETIKLSDLWKLNIFKNIFQFSKWSWDYYDNLKFIDILSKDSDLKENNNKINYQIKIYKEDMTFLENYMEEYFETMLQKLKNINYDQNKIIKRKNLTF